MILFPAPRPGRVHDIVVRLYAGRVVHVERSDPGVKVVAVVRRTLGSNVFADTTVIATSYRGL